MPTALTAPIAKTSTTVCLDNWGLSITRNADFSVQNANFVAILSFRLVDGTVAFTKEVRLPFSSLTAPAQTAVRNFHAALITYLRNTAVLPAGVDTLDV